MKCLQISGVILLVTIVQIRATPFDDPWIGSRLDQEFGDSDDGKPEMSLFRLPNNLVPESYDLQIEPDLPKAEFSGYVKITVRASESTAFIALNAKFIEINATDTTAIEVTRINTPTRRVAKVEIAAFAFDKVNERLHISLRSELARGNNYVVAIKYKGVLGKDMMGFYISKYHNNGVEKLLASTQFEPTGARRAFPCFDEPRFKTTFKIAITRGNNQKSISNMPSDRVDPAGATKSVEIFKESPPMPTYLVGFAVFEFESISDAAGKFRVWGREDVIKSQGQYIFEKGQVILDALSKYMGMDYYSMLPKMDLVAVPDFEAGAMENWGMNTYRERVLLSKQGESTTQDFQRITTVVAHEFSHQWFGDLVTPEWWDFTWLNEAFARYFEYFATHAVEPSWRMEDLFVVEQVQVAFNSDLKGSHAITSVTTSPESIADTFDHIIYNKGGSVLRMIENVVTPDIFQKSLQHHLKVGHDNLRGTVEPANLWDAFDTVLTEHDAFEKQLFPEASTIQDFTNEWFNQPGFPLIHIKRNYSSNIADVTQERFYLKEADKTTDDAKWVVPITYTTKSEGNFSPRNNLVWLNKDKKLEINVPNGNDWLIANLKEVGFYRVNYDEENWLKIAAQLRENFTKVHVLNRAQILDDAFTLARAGVVRYNVTLELTRYLMFESDFIPWYSAWSHIRYLIKTFADAPVSSYIQTYFQLQLQGIYTSLGMDDSDTEENMKKIGRSNVALWICNLGHYGCVTTAVAKYTQWATGNMTTHIPPNIKDAVYCMGVKHGSADDWKALWAYYLKSDLASEKIAVLYALGCSQDEAVLRDYLTKITDPKSGIRSQDHFVVIRSVLGESVGIKAGLSFLETHTERLLKEAEADEQSNALDNLKTVISSVGAGLSTKTDHDTFANLLGSYRTSGPIGSTINKTLSHITERLDFKAAQQATISAWFVTNTPSTPKPSPQPEKPSPSPPSPSPDVSPSPSTPKPSSATHVQITSLLGAVVVMVTMFTVVY